MKAVKQVQEQPLSIVKSSDATYGGYDPGSGKTTLCIETGDTTKRFTIPSTIATGKLAKIAGRSKQIGAEPASLLDDDEIAIEFDGVEYYVGRLAEEEGENPSNAINDPRRYSGPHSQLLLFATASKLIQDDVFEIRIVTALPASLFNEENRLQVQQSLSRTFNYKFNGKRKKITVVVGAVVVEGAGGLALYGDTESNTLVIDYGFRTTDILPARGQKSIVNKCAGIQIGVGQVVQDLIDAVLSHKEYGGRRLTINQASQILYCYANNEPLPIIKSNRRDIPVETLRGIIYESIRTRGQQLNTQIAQALNVEGATLAAEYDIVIPIGGGAKYFRKILEEIIGDTEDVEDPQYANPDGYLDIAISMKEKVWSDVQEKIAEKRYA